MLTQAQTVLKELLITFGMAMVPVIELRGAIPLGVAMGLPPLVACLTAILGNLLPVPFVVPLARHLLRWFRKLPYIGRWFVKLEKQAHLKGRVVRKYRVAGLILLVAIPLPGTGAWTGALVASLLDIRLQNALPSILVGLLIAGTIITALTVGVTSIL